jgi:hypothetical protein
VENAPREIKVQLGQHSYTVVPQRHAYLQRKLGSAISDLGGVEVSGGASALGALPDQAYSILRVFVPDLMPLHEWNGYASQDAAERDAYNEADDNSPDPAQIVDAFRAAMKVNRIDLLAHLKDLVGPGFLRAKMQEVLGGAMAEMLESGIDSGNTPLPPGGSPSANGGTAAPTDQPTPTPGTSDGPSPVSSPT